MDQTTYQIADRNDSRKLTDFLCQEGSSSCRSSN
jgi:hypothetical protein